MLLVLLHHVGVDVHARVRPPAPPTRDVATVTAHSLSKDKAVITLL